MTQLWCGSESSYFEFLAREEKAQEFAVKNKVPDIQARSAFEAIDLDWIVIPPIAVMNGDVAMIEIKGDLITGSAGFRRLFGMLGYEEIRAALMESLMREDCKFIMFVVNSGGGSTNGVSSVSRLIREVSKVKPVATYAYFMGSAAYWLGSSANQVFADDTATVGSIGTVYPLVSEHRMLKEKGIDPHFVRSGAFKYAGNSVEEVTPEVKAVIQEMVDDLTAIFFEAVATNRGLSREVVRSRYGDGRVFVAPRAQAIGLVDDVLGLAEAMGRLRAAKPQITTGF